WFADQKKLLLSVPFSAPINSWRQNNNIPLIDKYIERIVFKRLIGGIFF
mgnify:CR=1